MDLKDHIKVLQEEKKRIDEPIANDLRNYARLLADIEQTNSNYNNDKKHITSEFNR